MPTEGSSAAVPASNASLPGARHALILLLLINLFNYIDRQVLAAVEPEVARTFFPKVLDPVSGEAVDPPNSGFYMGLLSTAFLVTYMLTSPVFGALSTWMSRWLLIGVGVILWSLASGASGLATGYAVMLLTRCFVGVGEAVYGPVAPDVLSDLYPIKRRGQILAWFYAAIPFGGALGYALGDLVVRSTGDWRMAFYLVVPPGILLGVWCFLMREPPRGLADAVRSPSPPLRGRGVRGEGAEDDTHQTPSPPTPLPPSTGGEGGSSDRPTRKQSLADYLFLLKTPSFALNCAGMTAMTFAMGGMAFWVPRYLEYRGVEELFGVGAKTAFGAITALSGLIATLVGGWAGDALRGRYPGSYFLVSGAAMVVGFPLLLLLIMLPFPLAWVPLTAFVFCLFFNTGPTNTITANVCHPLLRAPGFALNILVIHLFGDAISPPIMGAIKDAYNLDVAFYFVSGTVLLGGVLWLLGARYLQRDTELAPTRLPPG